ncbi:hypothetical protein NP233_g10067 [Leucocoprinus birnbaumii]|uniref:Uncharacterized protein n=1 Tax=Leucocoprinus birnbaumii TaxID=56174 RepID=A0AAD5VJ88_9AGAR|nr:hypothetical protein NP233_g10067 [Leucocoprinus birnbaumii]
MPSSGFWSAKPSTSRQPRLRKAKNAVKKANTAPKSKNRSTASSSPSPQSATQPSSSCVAEVIDVDAIIESEIEPEEDAMIERHVQRQEHEELREDYEELLEGYEYLKTEYINAAQQNIAMYKVIQKLKPSFEILLNYREVAEIAVNILQEQIDACRQERDEWKREYESLSKSRSNDEHPPTGVTTRSQKRRASN